MFKDLLKPINESYAIGQEIGKYNPNGFCFLIAKNTPYKNYSSGRFLYSVDGVILGCLQVYSKDNGKTATISNLIVIEEYRRNKIATKLLETARFHFNKVSHNEDLSTDGMKFVRFDEERNK